MWRWLSLPFTIQILVYVLAGKAHTKQTWSVDTLTDLGVAGRVQAGPWGPCKSHGSQHGVVPRLTFEPIIGEQTRELSCDNFNCQHHDQGCCGMSGDVVETIRMCIVAEDCVLSEWSQWSPPLRYTNLSAPYDYRQPQGCIRTRTILSLPQGDGAACGPLEEHNESCSEWNDKPELVHWVLGQWTPCIISSHISNNVPEIVMTQQRCGGGLQERRATCYDRVRQTVLPDSACHQLPPPLRLQRCEVPCPRDCVVSEWGEWGPCEPLSGCPMTPVEEITVTGFRKRSRRIVVAGSRGGAPCGPLAEVQSCAPPGCSRWLPGPWSSCRLLSPPPPAPPGAPHCGPGRRERRVLCQDLHGNELSDEQCLGAGVRPAASEECRVACPRDCVLSPWGPWDRCSRPCSSRHHRAYRTRNRTIIAPPGEGGERCPGKASLEQREECNPQGCQGYSWLALPWQPCGPSSKPEVEEDEPEPAVAVHEVVGGGEGVQGEDGEYDGQGITETSCNSDSVQTREVWCMENVDRRVPHSHCSPLKMPETVKSCEKPCGRTCGTSPWTEWTPCPQFCEKGIQERERFPEYGWESPSLCGELHQRRLCMGSGSSSSSGSLSATGPPPHWAHGAWSSCQLPTGRTCGQGIMTRGVWCSLQHHKVNVGLCPGPPPPAALRCSVECGSRCQLSAWSPWLPCTEPCGKMATRFRKKLGDSPCPNTVLYEAHECPCQGFTAELMGEWSYCLQDSKERESSVVIRLNGEEVNIEPGCGVREPHTDTCGDASRYRRVLCRDPQGRPVEPYWCNESLQELVKDGSMRGLVRESCTIPCPVNCVTSQWSTWSNCVLGTGHCGFGVQYRTRKILINSTSDGRPCGDLVQSKVCSIPCETYSWEVGSWSSCQLIPRHRTRGCGTGDQSRSVRCVEVSSGEVVMDEMCDPVTQPADLNACHMPCPGECVLSDWSDWSQCPKPCNRRGQRDRTRALLRSGESGQRCPPLVQAQPCLLNRTCFHYHWRIAPWGTCLPLGGSPCGEGMQQRAIYCERSDGRQVNTSLCDSVSRPVEPTEQFCYVDCPIDCELSPWSSWDTSRCRCGVVPSPNNYILRTRRVLTPGSPMGLPCSKILRQKVLCPLTPCYVKRGEHFSGCKLDAGVTCGYGFKSRNVTCVRETDGAPVPLSFCGLQTSSWQDLYQEESCYVECRSECRSTEWSRWSECDEGDVRSRSRLVYTPEGPPCTPDTKQEEVFEYGSCNGSIIKLEVDITKWRPHPRAPETEEPSTTENLPQPEPEPEPEPEPDPAPDDYYMQQDDLIKKTFIISDEGGGGVEHTALAVGIATASMATMLLLIFLTVRYHKQRTIHKV